MPTPRLQTTLSPVILFLLLLFIFNWKIIALQYCVGLYYTSTWISHRYTYVPRPLKPSSHLPSHPTTLCCHRAPDLSSLRPTANSHWLAILHRVVYVSMLLSVHPTLSFPRCVHKSVPYVCISIAVLQIDSVYMC